MMLPASGRRLVRALLGIRLLHKILIANAAIVGLCVIVVALIARSAPLGTLTELVGLAGLLGVAASVAVNALLVRLALDPLDPLEGAAARVGAGDLAARAPLSPLADPDLDRLIGTFNGTLDQLMVARVRLRTIAARALDAAEEERKRVARELHDDTAQTLATLLIPIDGLLSESAELALYRILQEALSNVVRHARATRVRIAIRRDGDQVVATVQDDGRGFELGVIETAPDRGLGLFGMEERAAYIGGRMEFRSERGKGTRVRIEVPVGEAHRLVHHV